MNDFERRLRESLLEVRDAGRIGMEPRRAVAREELFRRLHRRRLWNLGWGALLAGGVAVGAFVLFSSIAGDPVTNGADIDPALQVPTPARAVIEVGDRPEHVAVGSLDYVWTSNAGSNDISRIDPGRKEVVTTVDVGSSPGDIAIGSGPVWVALPSEGRVVQLSSSRQTVVGEPITIAEGSIDHMELSVGAGALWVTARDQGLWRVDLESETSVSIPGIDSPTDVAVKGDTVYVLSSDGLIFRLSSATGEAVGEPFGVEPSDDGKIALTQGTLWYFSVGGETISLLDASSGEVVKEVDPPGAMVDFVFDPEVAWILTAEGGTHYLTPFDRGDARVSGEPIEVPGGPVEAAIARGSLWLTLSEEDVVLRFSKYR